MSTTFVPEDLTDELKMYVKIKFRKTKCEFDEKIGSEILDDFQTHELYSDQMQNSLTNLIEEEWSKRWEVQRQKNLKEKTIIESDPVYISSEFHSKQIELLQRQVQSMNSMQQGLMEKFAQLSMNVSTLLEQQTPEPQVTHQIKRTPAKINGSSKKPCLKRITRKMSLATIKRNIDETRQNAVEKWTSIDKKSNREMKDTRGVFGKPPAAPKTTPSKKKRRISSRKKKSSSTPSVRTKRSTIVPKKPQQSYEDTDESRKVNLRFGSRQYCALVPENIPEGLSSTIPKDNLELAYAHGFNGHYAKCRNNLLKRGDELVYNIAGAIICHDIDDNTQRFFTKHTEDITAVAMHPSLALMATGQLDEKGVRMPRICIWDLNTLELKNEIEGFHQNAVYHLAFSPNNDFLYSCAGDCDCTLFVFDLKNKSKKMKPIYQYSPISKGDVYGLVVSENIGASNGELVDEFITYGAKHLKTWEVNDANNIGVGPSKLKLCGHLVPTTKTGPKQKSKVEKGFQTAISLPSWPSSYVVGGNSGTIYLVQYHQVKKRFNVFNNCPVTCAVLTENGFLATSLKGEFVRFEANAENSTTFQESTRGDFSSIENISGTGSAHALQYDVDSKTLYVGSHRGQIFSVDFNNEEENIIGDVLVGGHSNEIWGLACHPNRPIFVTAGYDGQINGWDSHTNLPIPEKRIEVNEKFTCIAWSSDANLLVAGTESSKLYLIDYDSFDIVHKEIIKPKYKSSPVEQIGCVCFSPDNTILAVGHYDSSVYLYDVVQKRRKSYLKCWNKHGTCQKTSACTHLQFSEDGKFFKSFGRDYEIQYWNIQKSTKKCKLHPYLVDYNEMKFVGSPIIAGWETQGLLQKGMDGTDINTCSVTKNESSTLSLENDTNQLLVCGDDFGRVWLHNYPALDCTKSKSFPGHSAFVVDVKWNYDDRKVISIGGGDQAIFVWNRV